jgi:hypothetical protein
MSSSAPRVGAATVNGFVTLCSGPAAALPLRFATGCFVAGIYPHRIRPRLRAGRRAPAGPASFRSNPE